ncbi:MAG TPA: type VI secretion system protein TssA [Vicinamibacterales bacterium]|nr:type VI secretion system protein TssA [Vicinamibacterales bacterium]
MNARWDGQVLLQPISPEQPCGVNLDDSILLSSLDALRLFGQARSPEAPADPEGDEKELSKARPPLEWDKIRADALDGLSKSKDIRLLAYLGTALLRTHGLAAFAGVLTTASQWLEAYWPQVYPALDEDAIARRNALNCFADPMAVIDRIWRLPLVTSRQHGRYSLRDIEIARGQAVPGPLENKPDEAAISEAFKELSLEDLTALDASVAGASAALTSIDARMRSEGGPEVAPDFGALVTHFAKLGRVCKEQLASRGEASGDAAAASGDGSGQVAFRAGAINSRADAIRALDAVAEYFRRNEPSSPIPLFVDRAKRLVAKDFLEVLADIAPDALSVARSAGGLKDQ